RLATTEEMQRAPLLAVFCELRRDSCAIAQRHVSRRLRGVKVFAARLARRPTRSRAVRCATGWRGAKPRDAPQRLDRRKGARMLERLAERLGLHTNATIFFVSAALMVIILIVLLLFPGQ